MIVKRVCIFGILKFSGYHFPVIPARASELLPSLIYSSTVSVNRNRNSDPLRFLDLCSPDPVPASYTTDIVPHVVIFSNPLSPSPLQRRG